VRILIVSAFAILLGCTPPEAPQPKPDPAADSAYIQSLDELTSLVRQAQQHWKEGKSDQASALITQAQPLATRALAIPKPPLPALEAASDLDQLYATMLLTNRHYGWARMAFQKDAARWKNRNPQTPDTERRLQAAQRGIAECDRHISK
jgi:hypothetical protein